MRSKLEIFNNSIYKTHQAWIFWTAPLDSHLVLYNSMLTFVTVMKSGPKKTLFTPSILNNCL